MMNDYKHYDRYENNGFNKINHNKSDFFFQKGLKLIKNSFFFLHLASVRKKEHLHVND